MNPALTCKGTRTPSGVSAGSERAESRGQRFRFGRAKLIGRHDRGRGLKIDARLVAIDHGFAAVQPPDGQGSQAHDSGNAQGPRQNGGMG